MASEFLRKMAGEEEDEIAPVSPQKVTIGGREVDISGLSNNRVVRAKKEQESGATWLNEKNKLWEDGWQFGDITKTILGTVSDLGEDIGTGIIGMGETLVDASSMLAPHLIRGQLYNSGFGFMADTVLSPVFDQMKQGSAEFAKKDLYDEAAISKQLTENTTVPGLILKNAGLKHEDISVIGQKGDSLVQSAGQLGVQIGLDSIAPGTGMILMGSNAFGAEAENALKSGATVEEATLSGAISAGAEVLTEQIFGGIKFGGKTLDEGLARTISANISDQFVKRLAKFGLDVFGEGAEEWITEDISRFGQWLTYRNDENLLEMLFSPAAMQEKIDAFIGGAILGGGGNVVQSAVSKANGKDSVTGLTKDENAVVEKLYNDALTKKQKDGKLSARDKTKLYNEILRQMDDGEISIDKIEEILGGDDYKAYQDILARDKAAIEELKGLYEGDELKQKIADIAANSERAKAKETLRTNVAKMVKGERLSQSYAEAAKSRQKFAPDLEKVDPKYRSTFQRAAESGVLNDTRKAYQFVENIAALEADTGVQFDIYDDAMMQEAGFSVKGKRVHGAYLRGDNRVVINVKSPKAWQTTVGHEITHAFEKAGKYDAFAEAMVKYGKTLKGEGKYKNEYERRLAEAIDNYGNVDGYKGSKGLEEIKKEVVADMVGDYLFQDSDFVQHLHNTDRTLFQRLFDEVKRIYKLVIPGSKEEQELAKVKKAFEDVYNQVKETKNTEENKNTADGGVKYSIRKDIVDVNGKEYDSVVELDKTVSKRTLSDPKNFFNYIKKNLVGLEIPVLDGFGNTEVIEFAGENETVSKNKSRHPALGELAYTKGDTRKRVIVNAKEVIQESVYDPVYSNSNNEHGWLDKNGWESRKTYVLTQDGIIYEAYLKIAKAQDGRNILYAVNLDINKGIAVDKGATSKKAAVLAAMPSGENVAQNVPDVKEQFSLSDSNGRQLSQEQQEFFKDSKIRDENGNLKVMYHGTPNGDFTIFKDGTYFTESKEYADIYQNPGASSISTKKTASNPKTYEVYLDIKKPFDITDAEARRIYIEEYVKGGNSVGVNPYLSDAEYAKIKTIDWMEGEDLREFLIENEYDYDGLVLDEGATGGYGDEVKSRGTSYVVFSPEQVKAVDNKAPTSDPDIRFSLSKPVEQTKDLMALHNLTEQKLLKSLRLGGLPMPSVAIAKAQDGHGEFGEITLVLPREAIDPESSRNNKLYSGDAWTPTYPQVEYKPSREVLWKVYDKISELVPYEVRDSLGSLMLDTDNARDNLNRYNGDMVEAYRRNDAMKYAYLKDTGSDITLPMKEADLYLYGGHSNAAVRYFSGKLANGLQTVELYRNTNSRELLQDKALTEAVADAQNFDVLRTLEPGSDEYIEYEQNPVFRADEVSLRDILNFLDAAKKLFTTGIEQKVDRNAARELINSAVDQTAYESWLEELFDGVVEKEGIRNNKDYYTPSGNPRSFEALHYEHNLENVIKAMREKGEKGIGNGFGGASIFGASTTEFSSIEEMKQSSDRLQKMSYDEYQELRKGFTDRFLDIAISLPNQKNSFMATDSAAEVLTEAVAKYKTRSGIANYLRRELSGWATYSDQAVDDLIELVNDIRNMPTGYFEAKPQRAVGFDEVGVFVIPRNADVKLKQELLNRGYSIAEYDPDVEGDRQKVVNQFEEYKFSLSDAGDAGRQYSNFYTPANELSLDIGPVREDLNPDVDTTENSAPDVKESAIIAPTRANTADQNQPKIAKVKVNEEGKPKKTIGQRVSNMWESTKQAINTAVSTFGDKGWVFENLAKKHKNRNLEAKYNFMHYSKARAQEHIKDNLMPIVEMVKKSGNAQGLFEYLYHLHNIDRMSLEERGFGKNKAVFGDTVTADVSREAVRQFEESNPEFKQIGEAIVEYNRQLRKMLVDSGVISQETADLWEKQYPHYVPIRREGINGNAVTVPLDTNKTGVNAPIKKASGGNSDIEDLLETMVMRTEQTFKAVDKNSFGVELMNTLASNAVEEDASVDQIIDSFDSHEDLLQDGKNGKNPTFTVFVNGKRVTFDITKEMYDAMKPTSEKLAKTYKPLNALSNLHRTLITDKNPVFMLTNPIKDSQDVLFNSKHAAKTYGKFPEAVRQMRNNGDWFREYIANGGAQNTYFDSESKTFKGEETGVKKWIDKISEANEFIERIPRLAEYIASREAGMSIEEAMLDAARVTTNFSAGADVTKFLNRNGFTFLNASVQGAMQNVRNIREANAAGAKGWAILAAKAIGVGLVPMILNGLVWDDDEEYEELSDYVKQNYYIVAKTGDGRFIRIPKGRTMAVVQEAFNQMGNLITGDDEVDLANFAELVISNLAPNNPIDNNIFAPIGQVASNTTWYGEDLVPTRLQDVPDAEQFDESTDAFSKWLGENTNFSPYKINYLLNQYSGGIGDLILPMLTPKAEGEDDSFIGNLIAPLKDKFSTDPVMNNQNISDFYDKVDELTVNANSSKATDKDILMSKYMGAINAELSDLYKQKREIQNSDLPDDQKYAEVRSIQRQINELARNGLDTYSNVTIDEKYASVGDVHFRWYEPGEDSEAEPGWKKLTDNQVARQDKFTNGLDISPGQYWDIYTELGGIKSDKDKNGNTISGSREKKVVSYINSLDIDYGAKLVLYKSEYPGNDKYNKAIVNYIAGRDDLSFEDKKAILTELGFKVDSKGNVSW